MTNLTSVNVSFSKTVTGVDAADFLVNGSPAFALSGAGSNFTFTFAQPAAGTVNISWAANHGITDLATSPNAFNATGAGATWSYTLDLRTILVQSNANWLSLKAFAEASTPGSLWRTNAFDDSSWSNAPAPFFYGDPYSNGLPAFTLLSDMLGGSYSSIFLRKQFVLPNAGAISNLFFNVQSDDGFVAWINGVEVLRYNMAAGEVAYNSAASTSSTEPNNNGSAYILYTLTDAASYLVSGTNTLAVQAFNNQPTTSTDFGFNAQLHTYLVDPSAVPPVVSAVLPASGSLFALTNITVAFSESVTNVEAADLLVNGVSATSVSSTTNTIYTFSFMQPAFGPVTVTWAASHGIVDFDSPPKPFDGAAVGAIFNYSLVNPSAPTIAAQTPLAGATVNNLTQSHSVVLRGRHRR